MAKIVIMGGGIAGCTTAIELRKHGHEVTILEQDEDILRGTSARTPGRMGLGYHYFDSETAKFYMQRTIEFMKKYPDCFLGDDANSYLRNGRYFITNDSLIPLQDLMASYDEIRAHFIDMCAADPLNNIFGTPSLHRAMRSEEFQDDVNMTKVHFAIETKELLLDWQKFDVRLKAEMAGSGIIVKNRFEVNKAETNAAGKFIISSKAGLVEEADYVINCTWQNIEKLNAKHGIGDAHLKKEDPKQSVTSRLKLLAEVELPESLREKHSMFFCVGPHAMFSNLGNGIGRLTYAPVTNFGTTVESEMPEQFERWLNQGLSVSEQAEYGQKIIVGVAEYIPAMRDARLRNVIPGIVKSKGSVDLHDRNSPFHKRDYSGVEEQRIGWIDNAAMKLFYSLGNAKQVAQIVSTQEESIHQIKETARLMSAKYLRSDGSSAAVAMLDAELKQPDAMPSPQIIDATPPSIQDQIFENYLRANFKAEQISHKAMSDLVDTVSKKEMVLNNIDPEPITRLKSYSKITSESAAASHGERE